MMQALEYKLEMLSSESEERPKKGIASVEDIIKHHQDIYNPVMQLPLRITKDPGRKLSVSSNETDASEEESSSKETNEGRSVPDS